MPTTRGRKYTEADRKRLLAPIAVGILASKTWGGRSWGGTTSQKEIIRRATTDRYGYSSDWVDLDRI